jgi:hypothetical protein
MAQGPVYDNALRLLAAAELAAVCRWLGIAANASSVRMSEALPAATHYADLLAQVEIDRLAHVEFTRAPTPDMAHRMLEYRARIMRLEPDKTLTQHVVVLAGGTVPEHLIDGDDFAMRLHVTYLRQHEPAELLREASLAPLAVLGRAADVAARARTFRRALEVIHAKSPPERLGDLVSVATVLAAIHLDAATIEDTGRETRMPISLEGTVGARALEERAESRGQARGEARGVSDVLATLIRRRFGAEVTEADLSALAARLADQHREKAVDLILGAGTLAELRQAAAGLG